MKPRDRIIRAAFFTNDQVAALSMVARLLYIGLWTIADREGRLQNRPARIQVHLMPFDDGVDIKQELQALADGGFIHLYEVDGKKLIQIANWKKHVKKSIHWNETDSELPPCPAETSLDRVLGETYIGSSRRSTNKEKEKVKVKEKEKEKADDPVQEFVDAWHVVCTDLPKVREITRQRRGKIERMLATLDKHSIVVSEFLMAIQGNDYLCGRQEGRTWRANIDFVVNPSKTIRIIEGNYDSIGPKSKARRTHKTSGKVSI